MRENFEVLKFSKSRHDKRDGRRGAGTLSQKIARTHQGQLLEDLGMVGNEKAAAWD